jgi:hypothetical protein
MLSPWLQTGVKAYGGNRFRIAAIAVNPRVGPVVEAWAKFAWAKSAWAKSAWAKCISQSQAAQSGGINLPP